MTTLMVVLIYGYTAVPDAKQSVNRLLGSTGVKRKAEEVADPLEDVLQSKLGSPLVSPDYCQTTAT